MGAIDRGEPSARGAAGARLAPARASRRHFAAIASTWMRRSTAMLKP
jgi:hypothetical protein